MNTSTGWGPSPGGDHTFTVRQSSEVSGRGPWAHSENGRAGWGQTGPAPATSRSPDHGSGGRGAVKRCSPAVQAAYGMPRKARTPWWVSAPRTRPVVVATVG